MDCGGPAQDVPVRSNISSLTKRRSYDILEGGKKRWAVFYPDPKNLPEAKLKSLGQILLAEDISKQPNNDCHVVVSSHSCAALQRQRANRAKRNAECTV